MDGKPEINFLPKDWVIYPILKFSWDSDEIRYSKKSPSKVNDNFLADEVHAILKSDQKSATTVPVDPNDIGISFAILCCCWMSYYKTDAYDAAKNICIILGCNIKDIDPYFIDQIKRYKRPLNVIFCGDRNSAVCFEESIDLELKNLPKYSVIIHGGCKGVDLFAEKLAKLAGFETKSYPISNEDWQKVGLRAGPDRNTLMLVENEVDMVLAFHPDIRLSKGTKNMISQSYSYGVPVYIHDLKRKTKFEGNFDNL